MTDTHAHINLPRFANDLPAVLDRAEAANVKRIIVVGVDIPSSQAAVDIAARHSMCWASVGVHPHEANSCTPDTWSELEELVKAPKVVAVGETGLDYYRNLASNQAQQEAFTRHLSLAKQFDLPVVVHMRDSYHDIRRTLTREHPPHRVVIHCFSGDPTQAAVFIDLGCMISLAGPVTFRSATKLHEVAKMVPSDRLLVESDCPFLAPVPYRGQRNEPAHVRYTLESIARRRSIVPELLEEMTDRNAQTFFGIRTHRAAV